MPTPSTTKTLSLSQEERAAFEFDAIRIELASPEVIRSWSHGEVLRPETINYRTQRPEKDGLFCEKIFGPTKDWECYCGKYKRIRYKGIICDKCGVEVTRSLVRRSRMGHIELAVPTSHIWFLRSVPSRIGLLLDLSIQELEKVIYFANFIVISVNEELKEQALKEIKKEFKKEKKLLEEEFGRRVQEIKRSKNLEMEKNKSLANLNQERQVKTQELKEALERAKTELEELRCLRIISENLYQDLSLKYGHIFEASIGAEAIRKLLVRIDLDESIQKLTKELEKTQGVKRKKIIRRLRLFKNLKRIKARPEWMILTVLPIIPPDLRPMVQLDGGRFATSDLNDLYRRVINRNNRLKKLRELNAPEVICRNEKRMLQEAVDALIDNSARRGKTVTVAGGQRRILKSLADMLKGKQGRFRQNLLGKRVDYSGRSVIVVGPELKLNQCGLPKVMALELFKPFVISKLIQKGYVHNVRSASSFIETERSEVWDILEEVTRGSYVLLNRAPTLHRLGIQGFKPVLIEGKAIRVHPLVCAAFNADFDGDQMAVHLPLSEGAQKEAREIMLSVHNLLKPATGQPIITPSKDIVLGCFYLSLLDKEGKKLFASKEEVLLAYEKGVIGLHTRVRVRSKKSEVRSKQLKSTKKTEIEGLVETSAGRIILSQIFPEGLGPVDRVLDQKEINKIVSASLESQGPKRTVQFLDDLQALSFEYLTHSGLSWGMEDLPEVKAKEEILKKTEEKVDEVQSQYEAGLLTREERHSKIIEIWTEAKDKITALSRAALTQDIKNPVYAMVESGARGSWGQTTQMMGMKGLVSSPSGETIELPVKASFKEGFDVLEYFISTHGARKGLSDTALRTANAGYLTRRLIDVAQDVVITEEDCGDKNGIVITKEESEEAGENLEGKVKGRVLAEDIIDPKEKKIRAKRGDLVDAKIVQVLKKLNLKDIKIRSILNCQTRQGLCQKCYGVDLSYNEPVKLGTAVGIIAAQSIGEPGTQLTMRTFHTGGVLGQDITQGLPRVEELFEVRSVKKRALMASRDGRVKIEKKTKEQIIKIDPSPFRKEVRGHPEGGRRPREGSGCNSRESFANTQDDFKESAGEVEEITIPQDRTLLVKDGELVTRGQALSEGDLDLIELYRFKDREEVQKYIIREIQHIYTSQGQRLNDKHIEIIVRQMFSRVLVKDPGDTNLLSGAIIELAEFEEANRELKNKGKEAKGERLLLGITKASLSTSSFLSAASFQETARVLIEAATTGRMDCLRGLKENVIIGQMIPAGTGFKRGKNRK